MSTPPATDERHHDDDLTVSNFGWWALGGALGTALTVGLAFVVLIAMTGEPEYTNRADGVAEGLPTGPALTEVTLVATEFAYEPADATVTAAFALTLDNRGSVIHNFVVEGIPEAELVVAAEAGAVTTAEVELAPGAYVYFCSIPGHREAGMEGTLAVVAG